MSTGTIFYYSGLGLLALTVLLAILFIVKKPKYTPERAAYSGADSDTQKLRNGYPTDRITKRAEKSGAVSATEPLRETQPLESDATELLDQTEALIADETEPLTELLDDSTVPL